PEDQRGPGAKDSTLPLATLPRGRAVHRVARTLRQSGRHGKRLQGHRRRQVRRHPGTGLLHEGHDRRSAGSSGKDESSVKADFGLRTSNGGYRSIPAEVRGPTSDAGFPMADTFQLEIVTPEKMVVK